MVGGAGGEPRDFGTQFGGAGGEPRDFGTQFGGAGGEPRDFGTQVGGVGGFARVCAVDDVPDDDCTAVDVDGKPVAVVNSGGDFFAIHDICSHAEVALSEGDVEDCTIECWKHGSRFDLRTGQPIGPPATKPVPIYPTRVIDGQVYVSVNTPVSAQEPVK